MTHLQGKAVLLGHLYSDDRPRRVYRRHGKRYRQACIVGTVQYGGGSVMVWAGIILQAKTKLVHINDGTSQRCYSPMLYHLTHIHIGNNFIYM
jgi:hypothetical protein